MYDANSIIISHNHPGESLRASSDNINITKHISRALSTVRIKLLDHIIVAGDRHYSFKEQNILSEQDYSFSKSNPNHNDIAVEEDDEMEM